MTPTVYVYDSHMKQTSAVVAKLSFFAPVRRLIIETSKYPHKSQSARGAHTAENKRAMATKDDEMGTVVVGLGIAGKVRVRDLKEEHCGFRLRGVVSRRPVEMEGVTSYSLDEALADINVKAMLICSEPGTHEEYVQKALEKGKHVLVEYPLALSSKKAKELFSLAEEKGVILHEENIAMLTESYLEVKEKANKTKLASAEYSLTGKKNGWIENFDKSGLPFICGISSLEVMTSLFGDLTVDNASLTYEGDSYTAKASLKTTEGSPVHLTLCRSPGVTRVKHETYTFADGEVIDLNKVHKTSTNKLGLFAQDLMLFWEAIKEGKIPEYRKQLSISCLQRAEEIHSYFK